ncbi:MAG: hypothetical protein M1815_005470 [Lichina confinis]|nr:MAG: hypothetical protein M1815_005470 [Lichina confinis]
MSGKWTAKGTANPRIVMSARKNKLEKLRQRVGIVDATQTVNSAYHAYGWLGGFEGIDLLLSTHISPAAVAARAEELRLDVSKGLCPLHVDVLTGHGPVGCLIEDSTEAYGGTLSTQIIGLTLCALFHECAQGDALTVFMKAIVPYFFEGLDDVAEDLQTEINDNFDRIYNEGAARLLTDCFRSAVADLDVHCGDRAYLRDFSKIDVIAGPHPSEVSMLGGFLKWITQYRKGTYFTRSGLVARVAACLKVVGYPIGSIQTVTGTDDRDLPPKDTDLIPVVVVLGGSSMYDPLQLEHDEVVGNWYADHYSYTSVGLMLVAALNYQSDISPDFLQAEFEFIHDYLEENLTITYDACDDVLVPVIARAHWLREPQLEEEDEYDRMVELAEIYFPALGEHIAPCYRTITSQQASEEIMNNQAIMGAFDHPFPESLALFRAITAAIAISIASRLAPNTFKHTEHCINLDLGGDSWLQDFGDIVDQALGPDDHGEEKGLEFHKAVGVVAAVHAAAEIEEVRSTRWNVIGHRTGVYSVVPSLLVKMTPSRDAVGLSCLDGFLGNIRTNKNGIIRSSPTAMLYRAWHPSEMDNGLLDPPTSGTDPPTVEPPDVPITLYLGTPSWHGTSAMCLRGKAGKTIAGETGIVDVLAVLCASLREPKACTHEVPCKIKVINTSVSKWIANARTKPATRYQVTYVPVHRHGPSALFFAGQAAQFGARIIFRCVECVVVRRKSHDCVLCPDCETCHDCWSPQSFGGHAPLNVGNGTNQVVGEGGGGGGGDEHEGGDGDHDPATTDDEHQNNDTPMTAATGDDWEDVDGDGPSITRGSSSSSSSADESEFAYDDLGKVPLTVLIGYHSSRRS